MTRCSRSLCRDPLHADRSEAAQVGGLAILTRIGLAAKRSLMMSFGGPVRDKWITARNANNRRALPASEAVRGQSEAGVTSIVVCQQEGGADAL